MTEKGVEELMPRPSEAGRSGRYAFPGLILAECMDPKATNYKSYYVKADHDQCRYKKGPAEGDSGNK